MKKFNLSIEDLKVESFETAIPENKKGTIKGNQVGTFDCPSDHNCQTESPICGPTDNCKSLDCWSGNDPSCQKICHTKVFGCTWVYGACE